MSVRADQPVEIADYDPKWVESFAEQGTKVAAILAPWLAGAVEHIGSTAVPGMRAKPVVDVLAPVRSLAEARAALPLLERAGWLYWAEDPGGDWRMWFLRPRPEARTHHLHVIEDRGRIGSLLAFRDALRGDARLRRDYGSLKGRLAREFRTDREAYTAAKAEFVERVLRSIGNGGLG
jgi:GrpB-like predicted nucleotidyltransferase (UPF0157 family)